MQPCKLSRLLFHGTGARRRQSIERRGLLPKVDSYVYASANPVMAAIFATARAEQEDDWSLLVTFKAGNGWEVDSQFPESFRRRTPVPPAHIVSMDVLDPEKEIVAYNKLKQIADSIGIRVEL